MRFCRRVVLLLLLLWLLRGRRGCCYCVFVEGNGWTGLYYGLFALSERERERDHMSPLTAHETEVKGKTPELLPNHFTEDQQYQSDTPSHHTHTHTPPFSSPFSKPSPYYQPTRHLIRPQQPHQASPLTPTPLLPFHQITGSTTPLVAKSTQSPTPNPQTAFV